MLAPWLSPVTGLDFAGRRRAQTVRNDLTALGVTQSSSAAWVTLRSRASASKVSRHWMGGMRTVI